MYVVRITLSLIGLFAFLILIRIDYVLPSDAGELAKFSVYDSIRQINKPDISEYGFKTLKLSSTGMKWRKGAPRDKPDIHKLLEYADTLRGYDGLICLDIEHWDLSGDNPDEFIKNIKNFNIVTSVIRMKVPDAALGFYGIFPIRNYWDPIKGKKDKLEKWYSRNERLSIIAHKMDVIFPSLYTFYDNHDDWRRYAVANLKEARKYGKPVYAFLWPQYNPNNLLRSFDFIDGEFWRLQLETVREYADGVVIWTPSTLKPTQWDPDAEWWQETLKFMDSLDPKTKKEELILKVP